jgi:hypothetical protein
VDFKKRADTAAYCNLIGLQSRRVGAPEIAADSSREQLLRWLRWNDPNGIYSDAATEAEGYDPITLTVAWELLDQVVKES